MPGIVGFCYQNLSHTQERSQILRKMQDLLTHRSFNVKDERFLLAHTFVLHEPIPISFRKTLNLIIIKIFMSGLMGNFLTKRNCTSISTTEHNSDLSILAFFISTTQGYGFLFP